MHPKRDQDFFWEGVDRGELLAQKCGGCDALRHPPLPRCEHCGSGEWNAVALSGAGTVLALVESVHPGRREEEPRSVCLIDLAEGLRMVSTVADSTSVCNGAEVELEFETIDGHKLPVFRLSGGGQ
ncbi:MAG: OB-fold domain-containing protein [Sphingomonadaceae bacterium]|nr:OB-fold domain-containing protein [Sphingomonadaceae bacterium]